MSHSTAFTIGSEVSGTDGVCGELRRVVVNPVARSLTHLVVRPKHLGGPAQLVPVTLVDTTCQELRLTCTTSEFAGLEHAEETQFVGAAGGQWGYGQDQMLFWPYYGLGSMGGIGAGTGPLAITVDHVPAGDVEIRRGEHVHATDGPIGRVQGLIVDPTDHHVTHVLLDEGHLWGEKHVAIPIGGVRGMLSLTKDEVRDLPAIDAQVSTSLWSSA
jgi:hypothetical protein